MRQRSRARGASWGWGRPLGRRSAVRSAASGRRSSGAVPAEHPAAILELAPVLHQVAVAAYELFVGGRNHLDRKRFQTLLPTHGQDRVVLLLLLGRPSLPLRQELLQAGLHLPLFEFGGRGGRLLVLLPFRGLLQFFVLEGLVDVLGKRFFGHVTPANCSAVGGFYSPRSLVPGIRGHNATAGGLVPSPIERYALGPSLDGRIGKEKDPETFGAAAPGRRVLY